TFSGYPAFWINNQFRCYSFDVSNFLNSSIGDDHNLTIALESAWHYGLNATMQPYSEYFPNTPTVATLDN
ncbi:hypothetical protein P692DRAFT_20841838, partial [Suillus brevipes Sb2]